MLLFTVIIVGALVVAWFVMKDVNKPLSEQLSTPIKKADEINGVPPAPGIPEVHHSEEITSIAPVLVAKTKKAKITATEKVKKTPGRKKKSQ